MKIRLASTLQSDSIVDGEGIRTVVWTQGCPHNCPFCHNPQTHDFKGGFLEDVDVIKEELRELKGQDGITLSGGDPMVQPLQCLEIAKEAHRLGMNVWCYSGYRFEEIMDNKNMKKLLEEVDVLVDTAWNVPGVIGSRITGGGFGGCTVSIVENDAVDTFQKVVGAAYLEKVGKKADFYVVDIGDGAHAL